MKAAVYKGPGHIDVEDRPDPNPGAGRVVVEVSHCGICGTDLHLLLEGWGQPGLVAGHEYSGKVAALGAGVEGWSVGDPVAVDPQSACGDCPQCVAGRPSLCRARDAAAALNGQGAFARFTDVTPQQLHRVPDSLDLRTAALTEPLAVALHAVTLASIVARGPQARALVTGAGPIGMLVVAALVAEGIDDVTVSEPGERRRSAASAAGARQTVTPDELPDAPAMPDAVVEGAFDAVIECSGRADVMESALGLLAPAGTLVITGTGLQRPRFDQMRILLNELVVTGSYNYDDDGFERALALLASGVIPADQLLQGDDIGLDEIVPAMESLARGERAGKVLVRPY
jgi:(R,R)-butanediol dehydrogenase/meso-butanediol dehydrogenase/diacetyl reductase